MLPPEKFCAELSKGLLKYSVEHDVQIGNVCLSVALTEGLKRLAQHYQEPFATRARELKKMADELESQLLHLIDDANPTPPEKG